MPLILAKSFCITFFLIAFFYQVKSVPAYQNTTQGNQTANSQAFPSIQPPQRSAETPVAPNNADPAPDKIKRAELMQIFINGFIALFILWQAWTYHKQRQIMQGQLDITRDLKVLSEKQGKTFEEQRDKMQGQLDTMNAQAKSMQEQVKLATKQVEAMTISERAYLGIESIGLTDLEVGKVPRIVMIIKNAGRTPAKRVRVPGRINIELAGKHPQAEITKSRYIGDGMLAANATRPCVYEFVGICDENMLYQITSRNWIVFFQGTIWYEDVWGSEWDESFFLEWDNDQQSFLDRREKKAGDKERQNPA